jgi:hypothetical protein
MIIIHQEIKIVKLIELAIAQKVNSFYTIINAIAKRNNPLYYNHTIN